MGLLDELTNLEEQIEEQKQEEPSTDVVDQAIEDTKEAEIEEVPDTEEVEEGEEVEEADEEDDEAEAEADAVEEEEDDPKKRASRDWKERKRTRELRQKLEEAEQKVARLEGNVEGRQAAQTYNDTVSQQQAAQPEEDVEPDKNLYTEEWLEWKLRSQAKVIENLSEQFKVSDYNSRLASARQEMSAYEQSFAEQNADYAESKQFLRQSEFSIARIRYPQATDMQINQALDNQELEVAGQAVNNGQNPADAIYQYAKARGFTPGAKAEPKRKAGPNIAAVKKNKRKSASLMSGAAARKREGVTSEELFDMTMAERMNLSQSALDSIE